AEEKAYDPRSGDAEEGESPVHDCGDCDGREQCADDREEPDGEFLVPKIDEVEEKCAGEEQQGEQSVEDQILEADTAGETDGPGVGSGEQASKKDHRERRDDREEHGADGDGK